MKTITLAFLSFFFVSNLSAQTPECVGAGVALTADQQCCAGLKANQSTNICEDKSPVDMSLKSCETHAQCGSEGLGCFPQRFEDLFLSEGDENVSDELESASDEDPKANGSNCVRNADCESYSCVGSKNAAGKTVYQCQEKLVCRLADEGEIAPGPVACEPEFIKEAGTNKCIPDPNQQSLYLNFDDAVNVSEGSTQNRCELHVAKETQEAALAAITSSRAMEFLLGSEPETGEDCLKVNKYFRENLTPLVEARKALLKQFNEKYKALEDESKLIMSATKDSQGTHTILNETVTLRNLALRKATGLDMLDVMRRKNLIYLEYEKAMSVLLQNYAMNIQRLNQDFAAFPHHRKKEWTINGVSYRGKDERCRGGGFLGLGRKRIYKRWNSAVKITKDSAIPTEGVMKNLNIIVKDSPENIAKKFGTKNASGWRIVGGILSGGLSELFISIFGSKPHFLDPLKAISSDSTQSRENFKNKIIAFNKTMVGDPTNKDFIFEPELFDTSKQACLNNSAYSSAPECEKFRAYLENMADVSFAQNMAYSYSKRKNYKSYFNKDATWRRKLLSHYEESLTYLTRDASAPGGPGYYTVLVDLREKRNKCLEDLISGTKSNYEGSGDLHEGNNYYVNNPSQGGTSSVQNSGPRKLTFGDRPKYEFNMGNLTSSALKTTGKSDKSVSDSSSGSGSMGSGSLANNAMNTRIKQMKEANSKAAASGVDVAGKEKELKQQIAAYSGGAAQNMNGAGAGAGAGQNANGSTASRSGLFTSGSDSANVSTTDDMSKSGSTSNAASGAGANGAGAGLNGQAAGLGYKGGFSGNVDPYGKSSSSDSSAAGKSYTDPTGMSDEEKDVMMANYDRNRSKYETKEDDGLFKVISKAYVRSLDKVLTKKKKIEE